MIVSENAGPAYTPCPAGSYLARCVRLIDLGTQTTDYQGETKIAHKVLISWEIMDAETRREDGSPYVVSKRYTASLHPKAGLRKELASWRGRDFTPEELKAFNLANLLGKDCFISLVDAVKDGKTYTNIASIMKAPKGMTAPEGTANESLVHWDMANPDWTAFAQLGNRLQQQIEASPEFKALTPPARIPLPARSEAPASRPNPAPAPTPAATPAGAAGSGFDDMSDDMPF